MSDARMVSKIAWMIHGECMEWIENEDDYKKMARKLVEIVRKHDKRLTKRAADGAGGCAKCGQPAYHHSPSCFVYRKSPRR